MTMPKDINKTEEHPQEKKVEVKSASKCACGCGCVPPLKKK
jgi:hypothetical protein